VNDFILCAVHERKCDDWDEKLLYWKHQYEENRFYFKKINNMVKYFIKLMNTTPKYGIQDANSDMTRIITDTITELFSNPDQGVISLKENCDILVGMIENYTDDKDLANNMDFLKHFDKINIETGQIWTHLNSIIVDVYVYLRLFKKFKQPGDMPVDIKNVIIFLGYIHTRHIGYMLELSGFVKAFEEDITGSTTVSRCIKEHEPWF
jgi:hypothetical protein